MGALDRAHELLATWREEVRRELPPDVEIFDAHVHLGNDIDGMAGRLDELLAMMDEYGVERAFMFCLDEPDRHPGFRAPNDRTLAYAEQSGGRLIPFVRLDLTENPVEEAIRCLDAGARGIKLHPRAQKISLQDERLPPVFELAAERKVPILIHGGRGMPPIAAHLHSLVDRCDGVQLIVAHAGIADMANLTSSFAGMPGVFFDTSTWSAIDLLDFYRQMPPEQIVYASDYPYGRQPNSLLMALRTARLAGFDAEEIANLLGRNAGRIADGEPPLEPTEPNRIRWNFYLCCSNRPSVPPMSRSPLGRGRDIRPHNAALIDDERLVPSPNQPEEIQGAADGTRRPGVVASRRAAGRCVRA